MVGRQWGNKIMRRGSLIRAEGFCGWGVCHDKLDNEGF